MLSTALATLLAGALAAAPVRAPESAASTASSVDAKSWRTNPRIVAIRSLVGETETAIQRGTWRSEKRNVCTSEERSVGMDAIVVRDGRGRIRKYTTIAGSDDSAYTVEHHYDGSGRLRFAFAKSGAFNHSVVTYRLYFDENGAEIWRHETSSGPGYTFLRPPDFPDAALARDPAKDLATPKRCDP